MEFLKKPGFWTCFTAVVVGMGGLVAALWMGWWVSSPYQLEIRQQSSHPGFAILVTEREGRVDSQQHRFPVRQSSHPLRYRVPVAAGEPLTGLELIPNLSNTENLIYRLRLLAPGGRELRQWEGSAVRAVSEGTDLRPIPGGWFIGSGESDDPLRLRLTLEEALPLPAVRSWTLVRVAVAVGVGLALALVAGLIAALVGKCLTTPAFRRRLGNRLGIPLVVLLLSLPLLLSWIRGGAASPLEWVMEVRSEVRERAQVYFHDGRGWREFHSVI